jgi:hypothetical protein
MNRADRPRRFRYIYTPWKASNRTYRTRTCYEKRSFEEPPLPLWSVGPKHQLSLTLLTSVLKLKTAFISETSETLPASTWCEDPKAKSTSTINHNDSPESVTMRTSRCLQKCAKWRTWIHFGLHSPLRPNSTGYIRRLVASSHRGGPGFIPGNVGFLGGYIGTGAGYVRVLPFSLTVLTPPTAGLVQ